MDRVVDYVHSVQTRDPTYSWSIQCYHYETRTRTVNVYVSKTSLGKDGKLQPAAYRAYSETVPGLRKVSKIDVSPEVSRTLF